MDDAKMAEGKENLEIEKQIEASIPELRKLAKEKHGLEVPPQCDEFLGRCLRQKDGNLEKAVQLVQAFYNLTGDFIQWNANLDPNSFQDSWYSLPILCPLATRDRLGRRVLVGSIKLWNPDKISSEDFISAVWIMSQFAVYTSKEDQRNGYIVLWNLEKYTLKQSLATNWRRFAKVIKWLHGGVMGRIKGYHTVNQPRVLTLFYEGIKHFLSEKMKKRVMFHKTMEDLHNAIDLDRKVLPKFLGGDLETEECIDKEFMKNMLQSHQFFEDMLTNRFPAK